MAEKEKGLAIEKACRDAYDKFMKLGKDEYVGILSKLQYLIVSYNADKNPVGLYEVGAEALALLNSIKAKKPNAVAKKLIDDLEKALTEQ
ncbi:MAG: hypothetical protein MUC97_11185 [Bernardetiaceae bacterium]|jgi:hypothetical protein|nr:hypothetical protein [Bernardetiaceae bacterium]